MIELHVEGLSDDLLRQGVHASNTIYLRQEAIIRSNYHILPNGIYEICGECGIVGFEPVRAIHEEIHGQCECGYWGKRPVVVKLGSSIRGYCQVCEQFGIVKVITAVSLHERQCHSGSGFRSQWERNRTHLVTTILCDDCLHDPKFRFPATITCKGCGLKVEGRIDFHILITLIFRTGSEPLILMETRSKLRGVHPVTV
jgi:hypothetical protein